MATRLFRAFGYSDAQPAFARGDVLLFAGENWSNYDFDVIARLRRERDILVATVCQDLIPIVRPEFFDSEEFVEKVRRYADFLVREVDLVVAISRSTASDLSQHAARRGGMHGRIAVVQQGADFAASRVPRRPSEPPHLEPGRFVLSVSTIQPRKNFELLYRVWRRLAEDGIAGVPTLIIVGQSGHGSTELLRQIAGDAYTRKTISVLHGASDEELAWLYQNCLWTLYPSFYEGWGLPISESLAYGKYCLASNSSSLPEAGAGLIKHLDPLDLMAWRNAVIDLINSPGQLERLEKSIRTQYRLMTWAHSAEILVSELATLSPRRSVIRFGDPR